MTHPFRNYCLECEWTASTDEHTRGELSRLAIDHACSTGHDIAGERPGERAGSDRPPDRRAGSEGIDRREQRPEKTGPADPTSSTGQSPGRRVYSLSAAYRPDGDGRENRRENGRAGNGESTDGEN